MAVGTRALASRLWGTPDSGGAAVHMGGWGGGLTEAWPSSYRSAQTRAGHRGCGMGSGAATMWARERRALGRRAVGTLEGGGQCRAVPPPQSQMRRSRGEMTAVDRHSQPQGRAAPSPNNVRCPPPTPHTHVRRSVRRTGLRRGVRCRSARGLGTGLRTPGDTLPCRAHGVPSRKAMPRLPSSRGGVVSARGTPRWTRGGVCRSSDAHRAHCGPVVGTGHVASCVAWGRSRVCHADRGRGVCHLCADGCHGRA